VEQFLDDDELEEARKFRIQVDQQYDTFGSTAAELARRQASASTQPSGIPSLVPEELISPIPDSVGGFEDPHREDRLLVSARHAMRHLSVSHQPATRPRPRKGKTRTEN
jgi:hypothetical protein